MRRSPSVSKLQLHLIDGSELGRKATTTRAVVVAAAVGDDDDGRIHPEGREVAWMDAELLLLFW